MNEISQTPLAYAPAPNWLVIALIILIVMLFKLKTERIANASSICAVASTSWLVTRRYSDHEKRPTIRAW